MKTMIDLIKSSVVTQALITVLCLLFTGILLLKNMPIPDILWGFDSLVIGFYFGSKVGVIQGRNDPSAKGN